MVHYLRLIRRGIFMTLDGALYAYSLLFVVENHIPNTHTLTFLYASLLQRLVNAKRFQISWKR